MEEFENNNGIIREETQKITFYGFMALALVLAFGLGTFTGYVVKGNQVEEQPLQVESPVTTYKFYLEEDQGLVTVYRTSNQEVYEYTNILVNGLPEEVQQEIREKKFITNEEELYNFLESYTS